MRAGGGNHDARFADLEPAHTMMHAHHHVRPRPGRFLLDLGKGLERERFVGLIFEVEHAPALVVLEDLYSEYRFPRTALLMAHARGVVVLAARQRGVPVTALAPAEAVDTPICSEISTVCGMAFSRG